MLPNARVAADAVLALGVMARGDCKRRAHHVGRLINLSIVFDEVENGASTSSHCVTLTDCFVMWGVRPSDKTLAIESLLIPHDILIAMIGNVARPPSTITGSEERARASRQLGAWAGIIGPTIFVVVFTLEGWLRPGYDSRRMYVSALSLGPRGWIQIANFITVGMSFLLFSRGIAAQFPEGRASRSGPILLAVVGLSLLGSGPFVMDPMTTLFPQMNWHGQVHSILGAFVFSLGPASCFVCYRRFGADSSWQSLRWWTLAAGIVMTTAVVLLKVVTLPPPAPTEALDGWVGVIQRVAIVSLMSWVVSIGLALLKRNR
jgi:hypothetical membrane protein